MQHGKSNQITRATGSILNSLHWKFLCDRAVAEEIAAERGYRSALKKSELERLGFGRSQQIVPALVIPIHSVRGSIESYQLRPDLPRLNERGKPRKYEMKSGSRMLLDVHPRLSRPSDGGRAPIIGDPAVPLFLTEGIPRPIRQYRSVFLASACSEFGTGAARTRQAAKPCWLTGNTSRSRNAGFTSASIQT
jgi:hypothetical protein